MERNLEHVLYYETFKNNQVLNLYTYDSSSPTKYRFETIRDYSKIKEILPVIDKKMAKISHVSKKASETSIMYHLSDKNFLNVDYSNINYENAINLMNKQQRLENKDKDIEVKAANKKVIRNKVVTFAALAVATAVILNSCMAKNNKKNDKDTKDGFTIMESIPTMKPSSVLTPIPVVKETPVVTQRPTAVPTTQVINIEQERKFDFEDKSTPMPVTHKEVEQVQRLLNAALTVVSLDNVGTRNINKEIFTDPNAIAAAIKIINGDFNFEETVVSENNAFKGLVFIHAATSAAAITNVEDIKLSHYINDSAKRNEVIKVENMMEAHKNGTNNEKDMIDVSKRISKETSYNTKEIDFINASYIASSSFNFYKETKDGEFLSKLQNDLMQEINIYCFEPNTKTR